MPGLVRSDFHVAFSQAPGRGSWSNAPARRRAECDDCENCRGAFEGFGMENMASRIPIYAIVSISAKSAAFEAFSTADGLLEVFFVPPKGGPP